MSNSKSVKDVVGRDFFYYKNHKYGVEYYSNGDYVFFDYHTNADVEPTEELEQALLEGLD